MGGHFKSHRGEGTRHEQQHVTFRCNPSRLDSHSYSDIHGRNHSELSVRRGLLTPLIPFFFAKPKLEVEIQPRSLPIISDEVLTLPQPPIPDPPYEYLYQGLIVKAKKEIGRASCRERV